MAHSKRNTSLAFFTAHERAQLRSTWGSQSAHLTRDSFLPFAACALCLAAPAVSPVACPGTNNSTRSTSTSRGVVHLFCRECAISNLLSQKASARRDDRSRALAADEQREATAREDEAAKARAVLDFEAVQAGFTAGGSKARRDNGEVEEAPRERKRKFELDDAAVAEAAAQDTRKARRALEEERERREGAKALPSFWVPALTPSASDGGKKGEEGEAGKGRTPLCPASTEGTRHAMSLKGLLDVVFTFAEGEQGKDKAPTCPACAKTLSNALKPVLAQPCGHVLCAACVGRFVLAPAEEEGAGVRCYVCEEDLEEDGEGEGKKKKKRKEKEKGKKVRSGLLDIATEGTGFAAGGKNVVKKTGVSFEI